MLRSFRQIIHQFLRVRLPHLKCPVILRVIMFDQSTAAHRCLLHIDQPPAKSPQRMTLACHHPVCITDRLDISIQQFAAFLKPTAR